LLELCQLWKLLKHRNATVLCVKFVML